MLLDANDDETELDTKNGGVYPIKYEDDNDWDAKLELSEYDTNVGLEYPIKYDEVNAQLDVIGYVDAVIKVVPEPPPLREYDDVTE